MDINHTFLLAFRFLIRSLRTHDAVSSALHTDTFDIRMKLRFSEAFVRKRLLSRCFVTAGVASGETKYLKYHFNCPISAQMQ